MPALNRVELIGHLGRDPETRTIPTGKNVCTFSVAVNRPGSEEPDWFHVEAWNKVAEVCQQHLAKGRLVFIEGSLRSDHWKDDKGEPHSRTFVVARSVQMLDRKPGQPETAAEAETEEAVPA